MPLSNCKYAFRAHRHLRTPPNRMKLSQDLRIGRNTVTAYGEGFVDVNGQRHTAGLILFADRIVPDWGVAGFAGLSADDITRLAEECAASRTEIVLLGTGQRQRFPQPAQLRPLIDARIGVEVMDTYAACRTYNILLGEDRHAAAALLIDPA
jgi:uncharacterized protein